MAQQTSQVCLLCDEEKSNNDFFEGHWHRSIPPPAAHYFIDSLKIGLKGFQVRLPLKTIEHGEIMVKVTGFEWLYPRIFSFKGEVTSPGKFGTPSILGWVHEDGTMFSYRLKVQNTVTK